MFLTYIYTIYILEENENWSDIVRNNLTIVKELNIARYNNKESKFDILAGTQWSLACNIRASVSQNCRWN